MPSYTPRFLSHTRKLPNGDGNGEAKHVGHSRYESNVAGGETTEPKGAEADLEQKIDDWDGPDDPENPHNWSLRMRIYHTLVPSITAFVCSLGSSIITPGREDLQREFGVSYETALLPYVLYVLALGLAPLIAAPCSEAFGRRWIYWLGMPFFALFTLGAGFSTNIAGVIICRFLAGLFSSGLAIGAATVTDLWSPAERAVPMAFYVATPFLGPSIGPLIGGFVVEAKGWRWTLWTLLFFTAACLIPSMFIRESYKATILRHRARDRGIPTPRPGRTFPETIKFFLAQTLSRPVHMFLVEPVVMSFTTYVGINFGMLYAFFAAFPYVFETNYDYGLRSIGLTFIGQGVGTVIGCLLILVFQRYYKNLVARTRQADPDAEIPPEARLYLAMVGSIMLPVSLFWFAWSTAYRVHWICPVIAEVMFGCGNELVFMGAVLYVMDFYGPQYGASAQGSNTMLRYTLGAAFPLFIVQMYEALGIGWATSLLGFISLALTSIPWVLYFYGPKLRERSRYAKGWDTPR